MSALSIVTESELQEMLYPIIDDHPSINQSIFDDQSINRSFSNRSILRPRMIDGIAALRTVSTLDLICSCFYVFFILFGLLANFWVLHLVINVLRCRDSRSTISVPIYIFALTFLNILVLLGLPFTIIDLLTGEWLSKSELLCTLYWIVELMNKTMASFILTLLSISCYFAVCRPKSYRMYRNIGVSIFFLLLGFAIMFAKATPIYKHSGVFYVIRSSNDSLLITNYGIKCLFQPEDEREQYEFTLCCFLCGYAAPALIMITCYGAILKRVHSKILRSQSIPRESISIDRSLIAQSINRSNDRSIPRSNNRSSRFWRVAKSSAILVIFYIFSWTPYWTVMMTIMHETSNDHKRTQLLASVAVVFHILPYLNCACSPLLYTLLNKQMRRMYEDSRSRKKSRQKSRQESTTFLTGNELSTTAASSNNNNQQQRRLSFLVPSTLWALSEPGGRVSTTATGSNRRRTLSSLV